MHPIKLLIATFWTTVYLVLIAKYIAFPNPYIEGVFYVLLLLSFGIITVVAKVPKLEESRQ